MNVPYCKQAIARQKCRCFAIFKLLPISNGYTNGYIWPLHHRTCPQLQYGVICWVCCRVLCRYGAGPAPSRCANNGAFSNITPTELRIKLPAVVRFFLLIHPRLLYNTGKFNSQFLKGGRDNQSLIPQFSSTGLPTHPPADPAEAAGSSGVRAFIISFVRSCRLKEKESGKVTYIKENVRYLR